MSRLPQPGDAIKASRILNARMDAAVGANAENESVTTGPVFITPDGVSGPGLAPLLRAYGDLFDMSEVLNDSGLGALAWRHERDVEAGEEPLDSALVMLMLQGVAFGVLMERDRWERGAADRSILLSAARFALAVLRSDHTEVGAAHGEDACWLCAAEDKLASAVAAADAADEDVPS